MLSSPANPGSSEANVTTLLFIWSCKEVTSYAEGSSQGEARLRGRGGAAGDVCVGVQGALPRAYGSGRGGTRGNRDYETGGTGCQGRGGGGRRAWLHRESPRKRHLSRGAPGPARGGVGGGSGGPGWASG